MAKASIPGIKAHHRIITDNCRARGKDVAIREAVGSLMKEFEELEEIWKEGNGHQFHVVLTIEKGE